MYEKWTHLIFGYFFEHVDIWRWDSLLFYLFVDKFTVLGLLTTYKKTKIAPLLEVFVAILQNDRFSRPFVLVHRVPGHDQPWLSEGNWSYHREGLWCLLFLGYVRGWYTSHQWPCRNSFIGDTYHICLAYFLSLNFREYPSKIRPNRPGTFTYLD